jgi:RNA polymerase sigma-70 factor (ECF subfamily)
MERNLDKSSSDHYLVSRTREDRMAQMLEITSWNFDSGQLPYRDQLFKTALRMTRSVEETEDLLQETYLKAYRYYDRFEDGTNLKAWLFRIMKNTFINSYRKRKNQPQQVEFDELRESVENGMHEDLQAAEIDPEASYLEHEVDGEVRKALLALPHDYKMAVLMVDLQGFTYQEVADALAVPVGTIMSRLYRGRKKMERALLHYGSRYNYLSAPPEKLRDDTIDTTEIFASSRRTTASRS